MKMKTKNMDSFSKVLSGDENIEDRIRMATNNTDSVIVGSDAENNAVIIHSLSNLGGNLLHLADNIVGAVGMGNNPIEISIAIDSFCKKVKFSTPGLEKVQRMYFQRRSDCAKGHEQRDD